MKPEIFPSDILVQIPFPMGDRDIVIYSPEFSDEQVAERLINEYMKEFEEEVAYYIERNGEQWVINDLESFLKTKGCTSLPLLRIKGIY